MERWHVHRYDNLKKRSTFKVLVLVVENMQCMLCSIVLCDGSVLQCTLLVSVWK